MTKEFSEITTGIKRTLRLIQKPERIVLAFAALIMLLTGILTNLPAVILGDLVDKLINADSIEFQAALPFIFLIIGIILVREILTVIRKYFVENIATQTEKKQTINVIKHLLATDIAFIQQQQIGSLHGRIFRSIQGLIKIIKLSFLDFLPVFFSAAAAIVIALTRNSLLAGVMILVMPTGLYIIVKQISSQKGIRVALLRGKEKIDGKVVEMLNGIETVRALNTNDYESDKVEVIAENLRKKEIRHHIFMALFDAAKYLNEGFFYILVICLSIFFAAQGIISEGDILVYSILFMSITGPLKKIHRILDEAHESSIRVNDLHELLNQPVDPSYNGQSIAKTNQPKNAIAITNLSFTYPNKTLFALDNLNLEINVGEKIGIVGASGCGKSTLIKILLRLIHNYKGSIKILGQDLNDLNRESIAANIAYLPQKTYIFSGTIRENIIYGCKGKKITDEEILQATKAASLDDEINNALGGLNGLITENGNNLSGGQKQRLALARIILQNPEIIVLDEATSALDNINESIIQKNIEKIFQGKTTITIAHRLSTLTNTDQIIVLEKGKIVQTGKFDELASTTGPFKNFLKQSEHDTLKT